MGWADSSGVKLWFKDEGVGPPVLLLHELGSDVRQWRSAFGGLARFRCIAPSARGYPPSDVPEESAGYGWEQQVADALAVLDAAGINRAVVVGWSMGAYTALQLLRLHPVRVAAVVAVGVGSGSAAAEQEGFRKDMLDLARAWESARFDEGPAKMAGMPGRQALRRRRPQAFAAWLSDLATHSPEGMARTCRGFQAARPSLEDFAEAWAGIRAPVMLVVGSEDAACLPATRWLAQTIPGARLEVLEGAGHAPMLEDPEGFAALMIGFLDSTGR